MVRNDPIPDHLRNEWNETTKEIAEASQELQKAENRYLQAIIARIALRERMQ